MRLMANIKIRAKTRMFEYRRVVPERLRWHLPPVVGFPDKPYRTEFTQSLGTRLVREANQAAGKIDARIDAAFAEAERRLADTNPTLTGRSAPAAAGLSSQAIDPEQAFQAIDRWVERETANARIRQFNAEPEDQFGEEARARSELAYVLQTQPRPWERLGHFDAKLASALTSEEIVIRPDHPALP